MDQGVEPNRRDPLGRTVVRVRRGRADHRPRAAALRVSRSWASATGCSSSPTWRGPGCNTAGGSTAGPSWRSRATRGSSTASRPASTRRCGARTATTWTSRRRVTWRWRPRPRSPWRPSGPRTATSGACSSTPRWRTPAAATRSSRTSSSTCAARRPTWTAGAFIDDTVARIREQVGDGTAICGLSGGVDSSVAAVLVHRAIGDRLTCIFVDHGLLRKHEREQVERMFRTHYRMKLVVEDASRALPVTPGRRHRARGEAQRHRQHLHRGLRGHGRPGGDRRDIPGAGHALPGRHRVGVGGRPLGDDQDAPQRGRPPGGHALRADRAAARALQGRGAPGGAGAGPPRGVRRAPPFPGARPRHPHPGGRDARAARRAARGRRDLPRGDPRRRPLRRDLAGVRRAAARAVGGCHGRRSARTRACSRYGRSRPATG